ncbi:HET-domain-containing protein, partial [Bimuria novae-zelandiae CBS 107.79]
MRLLRCEDLKLVSFTDRPPKYAVLSHRWLDPADEPTMQTFEDGTGQRLKGSEKIKLATQQALHDRLQFLWVDTICIDKSSSTELSESINSMYRFYERATVCYAYLADVHQKADVARSIWFTRGWTLQELLAPPTVEFYTRDWEYLGTKASSHLLPSLRRATGIVSSSVFDRKFRTYEWTVAERMSWASTRTTERIEDRAYCLLGLFDVKMPLIYGEGENAFMRLQQQIMRTSDDHSIFAW